MFDLASVLPFYLQKQQEANAVKSSGIWDALAGIDPSAVADNLLARGNVIQPVAPQLPTPVAPQAAMAQAPVAMPAPTDKAIPVGAKAAAEKSNLNTPAALPQEGMFDFLKDPNIARALLMAGASQLSGDSLVRSAGLGFNTWDSLQARDAATEKAARDRKIEMLKLNDELANNAATRTHKSAQANLYQEQAGTEKSVRAKNEANAQESKAGAVRALAQAAKLGMETAKLGEADVGLMQEVAVGMGYTPDEVDDGKYLEDPAFLRIYNSSVARESARLYNTFDATEKKQFADKIMDKDDAWYDASAEDIKRTLDLDGVYRPSEISKIHSYIDAYTKRRDKAKEVAAKREANRNTRPTKVGVQEDIPLE